VLQLRGRARVRQSPDRVRARCACLKPLAPRSGGYACGLHVDVGMLIPPLVAGGRETLGRAAKSNRVYGDQDDLDIEDE
jgi:hypothetical protein